MSLDKRWRESLDHFSHSCASGRLAQAYLVVAPLDVGQAWAQGALQRLFCAARNHPCGQCAACQQVLKRTHPDIFWLEPQKRSRIIDIESIRQLNRRVFQTAYAGGWKAAVLCAADRLGVPGKEEAGNAFLKTLEEPPPQTLFLLLTDNPAGVLPTIVSRCQRILLNAERFVLDEAWSQEILEALLPAAGDPRAAGLLRLMRWKNLLAALRKRIEDEENAVADAADEDLLPPDGEHVEEREAKAEKEIRDARIEARYKGERAAVLRALLGWYRDLLICACGCGQGPLHFAAQAGDLQRLSANLTYRRAIENMRVIETMQRQLSRNLPEDAVFAAGFARLT
jgi:DNA polymerase-3 subunit delta'